MCGTRASVGIVLFAAAAFLAAPIARAQTYTVLHSFALADGINPQGALILGMDGNVYGTTANAGAARGGTVFKMSQAGSFTVLHSFAGTDGTSPETGVVQGSDGTIYGSTISGGSPSCNCGTIYSIAASGVFAVLHTFTGPDGQYPSGLTIGSDGELYGGTMQGGNHGQGTVFKLDSSSGSLTTLHSFAGAEGALDDTNSLVQATDGNFYGMTVTGGSLQEGTIFKIDQSGTLTTLHTFGGADGSQPIGQLLQALDGQLYGTTSRGGSGPCDFGCGTIFRIDQAGNLTTLHYFADADGSAPLGGLVQGTDRAFYGTTFQGGTIGAGIIFRIDTAGNFNTLFSFDDPSLGGAPTNRLQQGSDGALYGTAPEGGNAGGGGVLFRFTPSQLATCVTDPNTLCLNGGRFMVQVTWTDFQGHTGLGNVVPGASSNDSGLFWFFGPDNWELLVKVLGGCGVNGHYWVFGAAATDVGYTIQVTDTVTGAVRTYTNPLGTTSPAFTDTTAFGSCP